MSGPGVFSLYKSGLSTPCTFLPFIFCRALLSASASIFLILKMGGGDGLLSSHFHVFNTGSLFGTFLDFALSFLTLLIKNSLKILASFAGFVLISGGSPSF